MTDSATDGGPFSALLQLQDHDTAIGQLRHRHANLPERAELATIVARMDALATAIKEVQGHRDDLGAHQAALEGQIESARKRRENLRQHMFGGTVTASRDLQAMDEEVRHLAKHISDLEDREIEIMESLEPFDSEISSAEEERSALDARAQLLREAIRGAEANIDLELQQELSLRSTVAAMVPGDLAERYEKLRNKLGGTGAARLVGGSCMGCHLQLPAMEVDRIRKAPPDTIITCEQCGRILVR